MSERDPTEVERGQQPGADVGDDGDVPPDPLLPAPAEDEPPAGAEEEAS